jgi:hypothetical protein
MKTGLMYKPAGIRPGYSIPAILFLAFLVYYVVMMMLAPVITQQTINERYGFIPEENYPVNQRIFTDSLYLNLLKEKSFLQSRIEMAETDSICLTINMTGNIINLEISGVNVYKADIRRLGISKVLKNGNNYAILSMLAHPMTIINEFSSIRKEPLMIKMAPRDTSEYQPDIIPDTTDYELVSYIFEMDNGIIVSVYQEEKLNIGDRMNLFGFDLRYRIRNFIRSFIDVIRLRIPDYHPFIRLRLMRDDAKIIYRALPKHGQIAVCL